MENQKKKDMENVMEGHGILKAQKSTNPDRCVCPAIDRKKEPNKMRE